MYNHHTRSESVATALGLVGFVGGCIIAACTQQQVKTALQKAQEFTCIAAATEHAAQTLNELCPRTGNTGSQAVEIAECLASDTILSDLDKTITQCKAL